MTIGECKKGDIVWVINSLKRELVQVEILDDSAYDKSVYGKYKIPRKMVKVLYPEDDSYTNIDELVYNTDCWKIKETAQSVLENLVLKYDEVYTKHDHAGTDYADAFATMIFSNQQSRINCLENFIKVNGLWKDYREFEKRSIENLKCANPLCSNFSNIIQELKDYGTKQ